MNLLVYDHPVYSTRHCKPPARCRIGLTRATVARACADTSMARLLRPNSQRTRPTRWQSLFAKINCNDWFLLPQQLRSCWIQPRQPFSSFRLSPRQHNFQPHPQAGLALPAAFEVAALTMDGSQAEVRAGDVGEAAGAPRGVCTRWRGGIAALLIVAMAAAMVLMQTGDAVQEIGDATQTAQRSSVPGSPRADHTTLRDEPPEDSSVAFRTRLKSALMQGLASAEDTLFEDGPIDEGQLRAALDALLRQDGGLAVAADDDECTDSETCAAMRDALASAMSRVDYFLPDKKSRYIPSRVFAVMDKDGDLRVDRSEFELFMSRTVNGIAQARLAFEALDQDNSDSVSRAEAVAMIDSFGVLLLDLVRQVVDVIYEVFSRSAGVAAAEYLGTEPLDADQFREKILSDEARMGLLQMLQAYAVQNAALLPLWIEGGGQEADLLLTNFDAAAGDGGALDESAWRDFLVSAAGSDEEAIRSESLVLLRTTGATLVRAAADGANADDAEQGAALLRAEDAPPASPLESQILDAIELARMSALDEASGFLFDIADRSGDGEVTKDELAVYLRVLQPLTVDVLAGLLDANLEEDPPADAIAAINGLCDSLFVLLDANEDGILTNTEAVDELKRVMVALKQLVHVGVDMVSDILIGNVDAGGSNIGSVAPAVDFLFQQLNLPPGQELSWELAMAILRQMTAQPPAVGSPGNTIRMLRELVGM